VCRDWQLDPLGDDLVLPVSELITNAVIHAGTDVIMTISLAGECLEVAIRDQQPHPPDIRDLEPYLRSLDAIRFPGAQAPVETEPADGGRGIPIVHELTDGWGVNQQSDGKEVWLRVHVPQGWQPRSPCPCGSGNVTTPGGLRFAPSR
jgi:anti-sigma regulatory factor (Ser/Thr protein kinase)